MALSMEDREAQEGSYASLRGPQGEPGSAYKMGKREGTFPAWPSRLPSVGCGSGSEEAAILRRRAVAPHMTELLVSLARVLEIFF